jgi:hypothetical protein
MDAMLGAMQAQPAIAAGTVLGGDFRIDARLGVSGMGLRPWSGSARTK